MPSGLRVLRFSRGSLAGEAKAQMAICEEEQIWQKDVRSPSPSVAILRRASG